MGEPNLAERVQALERELATLKAALAAQAERWRKFERACIRVAGLFRLMGGKEKE